MKVEFVRGSVGELHHRAPFARGRIDEMRLWVMEFERPAIVLGSRQPAELLDERAVEGLEVVRRRSGGGAVLLHPDAVIWVDLIAPHGELPDDVRGSMLDVGHRWRTALVAVGAIEAEGAEIHDGGLIGGGWADLVCWAGLGPGEVSVGGRKLVGLSQRRTRDGVRVQGMVHRRSTVEDTTSLFDPAKVEAPEIAPLGAASIGAVDRDALVWALAV